MSAVIDDKVGRKVPLSSPSQLVVQDEPAGRRLAKKWLCGMGPQGDDLLKPMVIRDRTAGTRWLAH